MTNDRVDINEATLIKEFYRINFTRYEIVVSNMYVTNSFSESDIFAVRPSGFCDEIEIKLTASDFKADFNKVIRRNCLNENKHDCIRAGSLACNYFSFLVPEDIVDKIDVPDYSGLYVATIAANNNYLYITEVKKPKKLHSNKISLERKYKMLKKLQYRYWQLR